MKYIEQNIDKYQDRYLEHVDRKQKYKTIDNIKHNDNQLINLVNIIESRRSQRIFNNDDINDDELKLIKHSIMHAPSSCNRQAVYLKEADPTYIEEHFRGANKWGKNAKKGYIVMAAKKAYKNPKELPFMPYLDAGFVCQNIYLICEAMNIGCCFINPNCDLEENDFICGAILLGKYDKKAIKPPLRSVKEVLINDNN